MGRAPCCTKEEGLRKGKWSVEEDQRLRAYILEHGHGNWRTLPKLAGLMRCGKSARLRWMNYLRPDLKRGNFTADEDELLIKQQAIFGNRWAKIATFLPGRTDNEIKNHWHTNLKKLLASSVPVQNQKLETMKIKANDESIGSNGGRIVYRNLGAEQENDHPRDANFVDADYCASACSCIGTARGATMDCNNDAEQTDRDPYVGGDGIKDITFDYLDFAYGLPDLDFDWWYDSALADDATSRPTQPAARIDAMENLEPTFSYHSHLRVSEEEIQMLMGAVPLSIVPSEPEPKPKPEPALVPVPVPAPEPAPTLVHEPTPDICYDDVEGMVMADGSFDPNFIKLLIDDVIDELGTSANNEENENALREIELLENAVRPGVQQSMQNDGTMAWWIKYLRSEVAELKNRLRNRNQNKNIGSSAIRRGEGDDCVPPSDTEVRVKTSGK